LGVRGRKIEEKGGREEGRKRGREGGRAGGSTGRFPVVKSHPPKNRDEAKWRKEREGGREGGREGYLAQGVGV
jgi:hypothetical protein